MSAKVSSKKAQEGINNRLQVVMRSGKYTVRSLSFIERRIISLRVQDDDDFGGPLDWILFLRRRWTTTSRDGLFSKSL